jgi:hypothetical protein
LNNPFVAIGEEDGTWQRMTQTPEKSIDTHQHRQRQQQREGKEGGQEE